MEKFFATFWFFEFNKKAKALYTYYTLCNKALLSLNKRGDNKMQILITNADPDEVERNTSKVLQNLPFSLNFFEESNIEVIA